MNTVIERQDLQRAIGEEPYQFSFFQAVRVIERLLRDRNAPGRFAHPQTEAVRFAAHNSNAFPASEIQSLQWRDGRAPLMVVNFMGLTGPEGVLPLYRSEE